MLISDKQIMQLIAIAKISLIPGILDWRTQPEGTRQIIMQLLIDIENQQSEELKQTSLQNE